jgi:hypothetical protein
MENLHGKRIQRMNHDEMLSKIESLKTDKGGWTKDSLKSLGVEWPPPSGWKNKLLQEARKND